MDNMRLLAVVAVGVLSGSVLGDIIYVDDDTCPDEGSGTEMDPYCSIQTAIDNAVDGDEIQVAPGTYFETINFLGLAIWLHSSEGAEVTILDGGGESGTVVLCMTDEGSDTILDGFTITGGNASHGGGMHNLNSSPTVTECTFSGNTATSDGGGMFNDGSSPTVTECTFIDNIATSDGGGMQNRTASHPVVTTCEFIDNIARNSGGGMRVDSLSSATVTDCMFLGNKAGQDIDGEDNGGFGGGMSCSGAVAGPGPIVSNCIFIGNSAGIDLDSVNAFGGALHSTHSNPHLFNCTFSGNSAPLGGATFNDTNGHPVMVNCTFSGNSASNGGGVYVASVSATLRNCTFNGNSASRNGGGIYNAKGSNAQVFNCILWGDSPDEISGIPTVTYSNVQGGFDGEGNIDADPMFVDADGPDDIPGNEDDDLRLLAGSPCIDAGHNWRVPIDENDYDEDGVLCELFPVDLDGNPRFNADEVDVDPGCGVPVVVDMGAYEYQFDPVDQVTFADLNGDNVVGATDLLGLLVSWGPCGKGCCLADLNVDGSVGATDLLLLLVNWGPCP